MKNKYNPSEVETKWQKVWEEKKVYKPDLKKVEKTQWIRLKSLKKTFITNFIQLVMVMTGIEQLKPMIPITINGHNGYLYKCLKKDLLLRRNLLLIFVLLVKPCLLMSR